MAFLSPSWGLLGALALVCVLSLSGVAVQTSRLGASQVSEKAARADLEAHRNALEDLQERNRVLQSTNTRQSTQLAAERKAVRGTLETIRKERQDDPASSPVLTGTQLDRMRRLTEAGNASIRRAIELP